ncbi:Structural maintenance of chromosomes protein 3 [Clydaea vesicula]|uniref:Structural maintenance of chromosomes protein 3 n=1 Tax=Clydaea vesicula TaxID=447962 RepID=A0AAD5U6J3_9FUNG|nr:Structural maintenance of chromosomes protein 3 [Clydaea vesicula]
MKKLILLIFNLGILYSCAATFPVPFNEFVEELNGTFSKQEELKIKKLKKREQLLVPENSSGKDSKLVHTLNLEETLIKFANNQDVINKSNVYTDLNRNLTNLIKLTEDDVINLSTPIREFKIHYDKTGLSKQEMDMRNPSSNILQAKKFLKLRYSKGWNNCNLFIIKEETNLEEWNISKELDKVFTLNTTDSNSISSESIEKIESASTSKKNNNSDKKNDSCYESPITEIAENLFINDIICQECYDTGFEVEGQMCDKCSINSHEKHEMEDIRVDSKYSSCSSFSSNASKFDYYDFMLKNNMKKERKESFENCCKSDAIVAKSFNGITQSSIVITSRSGNAKDQTTIEPFHPKHNVIVGRNGSGKSNFFAAIRFILNDAYSNMSREERQALLHEGSSPTISAYVQIEFDNSDNRFPTGILYMCKDTVILRRTIGLKKDEYSLDKKSATKADIANLLESAGFSRSNPYYIVPQGRITALTNAKDHERLAVLRDVAGTSVYEQRRIDSLKIMEETEQKKAKINELMEFIQQRMDELEEEKKELKMFQQKDRERRCLQYTIYSKDQEEIDRQIEESIENEIFTLNTQKEALNKEKEQILIDREEEIKAKQNLELLLGDLNEDVQTQNQNIAKLNLDLTNIQEQITKKESELHQLLPEFENLQSTEVELNKSIKEKKIEQTCLYSKQGRNNKFRSKKERDIALKSEIEFLNQNLAEEELKLEELVLDIENQKVSFEKVENDLKVFQSKISERKRKMENFDENERKIRFEKLKFEEERKTLWRKDAQSSQLLNGLKDKHLTAKRTFESTLDRSTNSGLQAVSRIAERLGLSDNVYGKLYELFEVDERFQTAVEVVSGGSLFHIVVDTDETATRILEIMTREKAGRVTFMPLNRLKPKEFNKGNITDEVLPMIDILRFESHLRPVFLQVFGKAVICENLDVCDRCARSHGLTAVTMDGDRVGRKGEITGGFHDKRRSRLEAIKNLKLYSVELETEKRKNEEIQKQIQIVDQTITKLRDETSKLEREKIMFHDLENTVQIGLSSKQREEIRLKEVLKQKEKSLENVTTLIQNLKVQIELYEKEMSLPLLATLTDEETKRLDELNDQLKQLDVRLQETVGRRVDLQERKSILEVELNENLFRRRNDIQLKLASLNNVASTEEITARKREFDSVNNRVFNINSRLEEIEKSVSALEKKISAKYSDLESNKNLQQDEKIGLQKEARTKEKYMSKKVVLINKKEECEMNIRELGLIPDEAFEKFKDLPNKKLLGKLHKVNESLKKYGHVNKKAVEQYNNFTEQRESLEKRKEELDSSGKSIEELIKTLDQRKNEAIKRTFKQVSKNFSEVWEKLVSTGSGRLEILRKDGTVEIEGDISSSEEEESQSQSQLQNTEIEKYSGIAINVSFNQKTDEGLRMGQLSGGQKTLVALALIFSIQRCDPAPFYLFDEIDAALDAAYRTSVANMIHELCETAQFITTTFRPEMLNFADKFYGVTFNNKVSKIQVITRDNAREFVEQEQPH